ncbi:helix-turn-helix domain-containing protein [Flavilitoribacter nigricans]|uniref:helix-turn-helix domain-containing protein n=1 Tax=Flavilitoribacter nigricans TaxID=70997 RepID=UPI001C9E5C0B|nr:helix-turn-helix domain-containing protein [Flavilitoribacter nigricans]
MKPIKVELKEDDLKALEQLYHQTKDVRMRTRAQIILLNGEQCLVAGAIASIVRMNEVSVQRILHRYQTQDIEGLKDEPRSGRPPKMTAAYLEKLIATVRRRPRALELDYSVWTLDYLRDYMAEQTGILLSRETIRRHLKKADITFSRPQHKISSPDPDYEVKKKRSKKPENS